MHNDLIVEDSGKEGLDNVPLDIDRRGLALETVAYCIDGSVDERGLLCAVLLGCAGVRGEVGGGYELAYAIESGICQLAAVELGGQLQGREDDIWVGQGRVCFFDGLEGRFGQVGKLLIPLGLFGSLDDLQGGHHEDERGHGVRIHDSVSGAIRRRRRRRRRETWLGAVKAGRVGW